MKILITGSSGFCGTFLKNFFQKYNSNKIISLSRKKEDGNHIVFDLKNPIPDELISEKIDCIIHCASVVDEKNNEYSILENNIRLAYNIQDFVKRKNPKHLINFSSISVYGVPNSSNIDESFIPKPVSVYGLSKLLTEQLFEATIPKISSLVNLRLGYILGPKIPSRYAFSRLNNLLKNNQPISLINPDSTRFPFIDIHDIAKICEKILETNLAGTFNVVSDTAPTLRESFNLIKNLHPHYNNVINENENPKTEFSTSFSNKKIKQSGVSFKDYSQSFKEIFTCDAK